MIKKPYPSKEVLDSRFVYDEVNGHLIYREKFLHIPAGTIAGKSHDDYIYVKIDGQEYLAHVLMWIIKTGEPPPRSIDHKDTDGSNNRWLNLRLATGTENNVNTVFRKPNKTGYRRVSKRKSGKYRARIKINGKLTTVGTFDTAEEASNAYEERARKEFGEFYR